MAARLSFAPAVQIIRSEFPLHGIWSATRSGGQAGNGAQDILISRPEFDPALDLLPPGAAVFLTALRDMPFGAAFEAASAAEAEFDITATLTLALSRSLFTELTT